MRKCKDCKYYVFSTTIGSPDKPVWHCRDGFSPRANSPCEWDCFEFAQYNDRCKKLYFQRHPEVLQLSFDF